jgi:hypothetical protein
LQELIFIKELGVQERLNFAKTSWKIIHYFLFVTYQEKGVPTDPKHAYVCVWFPLDNLPEMFWQEQRAFLEEKNDEMRLLVDQFLANQEKCSVFNEKNSRKEFV